MKKDKPFMKNNVFFVYISHPVEFSIFPFILGYERCSQNKDSIGPQKKPCHLLHFIIRGSGYLSLGGIDYTIRNNQLFYIPPECTAIYRPDKSDPWEYMWIEFNGYNCKYFCDKAHLSEQSPIYTPLHPEKFYELFSELLKQNMAGSPQSNSPRSIAALLNLFALLCEDSSGGPPEDISPEQAKLQPVLDFIHANFCTPDISLRAISEQMFFNESYLCRIFKQSVGISPQKYIINLRMQKAREMLMHSTFSISNISLSVGYKSPYYFSQEFKRMFNLTPSQYRRNSYRNADYTQ